MSALAFFKTSKGKVILATVAALHITIYVAKPSYFKSENKTNPHSAPPKYLPEN